MPELEIKQAQNKSTAFLKDFEPLKSLWDGPNAPYPSEYSARWAVRKLRVELAQARAVALHRSRLMIHPVRFALVAEKAAINQFANRINLDPDPTFGEE